MATLPHSRTKSTRTIDVIRLGTGHYLPAVFFLLGMLLCAAALLGLRQ